MSTAERGSAIHLQLELYERMAQIAGTHGVSVEQAGKLIEAHVMDAMKRRWWEARGYKMPERNNDAF